MIWLKDMSKSERIFLLIKPIVVRADGNKTKLFNLLLYLDKSMLSTSLFDM